MISAKKCCQSQSWEVCFQYTTLMSSTSNVCVFSLRLCAIQFIFDYRNYSTFFLSSSYLVSYICNFLLILNSACALHHTNFVTEHFLTLINLQDGHIFRPIYAPYCKVTPTCLKTLSLDSSNGKIQSMFVSYLVTKENKHLVRWRSIEEMDKDSPTKQVWQYCNYILDNVIATSHEMTTSKHWG